MIKPSDFRLITDYTAIKSLKDPYSAFISIGSGAVSDGQQWEQTIDVPAGKFTILPKITINGETRSSFWGVDITGSVYLAVALQRVSDSQIRLIAEVDVAGGGTASISSQSVSGSFVAVFSAT